MFEDLDLSTFWRDGSYSREDYEDESPSDEAVAQVERVLGVRLPASYVALMRQQNGGMPARASHRTAEGTSWADDHVAITGIFSIGSKKRYSLCGDSGSRFWIEEWNYPDIGVYFADCPSAGHDMLCLDYRTCGPEGEPQVVHVDQDFGFKVTFVAENFEAFVRGLEPDEAFALD